MKYGSSTRPEFLWNDWRYGSSWPNPKERHPAANQGPSGMFTSPTWFGPVLL